MWYGNQSAEQLDRQWIGIDITHLTIGLIKHRLQDSFGGKAKYEVIGEPVSLPDAKELALEDRYQFEAWALGMGKYWCRVDGKPTLNIDQFIAGFIDGPAEFKRKAVGTDIETKFVEYITLESKPKS